MVKTNFSNSVNKRKVLCTCSVDHSDVGFEKMPCLYEITHPEITVTSFHYVSSVSMGKVYLILAQSMAGSTVS